MNALRYQVKNAKLHLHRIYGVDALHPEARQLLDWLTSVCLDRGLAIPTVTEFGRTRDDQERLYFAQELLLVSSVLQNGQRERLARERARNRFSWHLLSKEDGLTRAFDIRTNDPKTGAAIYTQEDCSLIVRAAKAQFAGCEALHHAVKGNAAHLHFARPDPRGMYDDWF